MKDHNKNSIRDLRRIKPENNKEQFLIFFFSSIQKSWMKFYCPRRLCPLLAAVWLGVGLYFIWINAAIWCLDMEKQQQQHPIHLSPHVCFFFCFFSQPSDFSISLKAVGKNKHFKVQQQDGVYCIGQRRFSSMDELVEHYKKAPIFTSEEGDKLYLVKPLAWICSPPPRAPPFPSFLLLSLAPFRSNFKDYLTFQSPTMPPLLLGAVAT